MTANPEKAIRYMQGLGRLDHPGACLFYVWQAYKYGGASTGLSARTALEAWGKTLGRHPGDRNPPRGAAVWWGAKPGSAAGDVVISLGGGRVIATDQPRYGVVGEATIAERERLIGRPYLGWSDHIFDAPIDITSMAGISPAPDPGGFLMALTDTQQRQMYEALVKGGPTAQAYYTPDAIINVIRTELEPAIASIAAGGILYPGQPYLMADAIVNAVRADGGSTVTVDEDAIAAKLVTALVPLLSQHTGTLSDADLSRIATAVNDEQHRRSAN